jgi:hypothetical protein
MSMTVTLGQADQQPGRDLDLGNGITVRLETDYDARLHYRTPDYEATVILRLPSGADSFWPEDQDLREWLPTGPGGVYRDAQGIIMGSTPIGGGLHELDLSKVDPSRL